MRSKHTSSNRLYNKCDNDFDTLILNPLLIDKVRGKCVCIIDDYITNGYSAEAAKHILFQAGVEKVIFISMGKFGTKYYETNYQLSGDVSNTNYNYTYLNQREENFVRLDPKNDIGILNFGGIV